MSSASANNFKMYGYPSVSLPFDTGKADNHVTYFWLFCTCIRTEQVRKLFSTSLILNKFSGGKVQIHLPSASSKQLFKCYVMRCSFLHNLEQTLSLLEAVWKNTAPIATARR